MHYTVSSEDSPALPFSSGSPVLAGPSSLGLDGTDDEPPVGRAEPHTILAPATAQQLTPAPNPPQSTPIPPTIRSSPTPQPAQISSSAESPTHTPPSPARQFAYVAVLPPSRKRPPPSEETSDSGTDDADRNINPTFTLDGRHPEFLRKGEEFLLSIPGGDDWQTLLSRYAEFEGLAPPVRSAPIPPVLFKSDWVPRSKRNLQHSPAQRRLGGGFVMVVVTSSSYPRSRHSATTRSSGSDGGLNCNPTGGVWMIGPSLKAHLRITPGMTSSSEVRMVSLSSLWLSPGGPLSARSVEASLQNSRQRLRMSPGSSPTLSLRSPLKSSHPFQSSLRGLAPRL